MPSLVAGLCLSMCVECIGDGFCGPIRKTMGNVGTLSRLEKFWQISLYLTDDAKLQFSMYDLKLSKIEGKGRQLRHIGLSNSVICENC